MADEGEALSRVFVVGQGVYEAIGHDGRKEGASEDSRPPKLSILEPFLKFTQEMHSDNYG
ncbi:hypothetical protein thsps21_19630 [Pseudomonas sp. No.21]|uniref:Uncharacterized protein n=1 Tax=Pseudomonas tohonis TaxID=2725477 RepID=A0A6J4E3F6_9PSED|nr:hypothetical protein TUM18999_19570 [Pseudomonas tohonis]GJN51810.1 hypothetical protein TUM20286_15620 [Pseudomonas tohonis]